MGPEHGVANPFVGVDLPGLDAAFSSYLTRAAVDGGGGTNNSKPAGLSVREKRLFRFGVLAGLSEWSLARDAITAMLDAGLLSGPEAERAVAEAGVVRGWPACIHLGPALDSRGLKGPTTVADALARGRAAGKSASDAGDTPGERLTDREVFALGLGITWGARCWDT